MREGFYEDSLALLQGYAVESGYERHIAQAAREWGDRPAKVDGAAFARVITHWIKDASVASKIRAMATELWKYHHDEWDTGTAGRKPTWLDEYQTKAKTFKRPQSPQEQRAMEEREQEDALEKALRALGQGMGVDRNAWTKKDDFDGDRTDNQWFEYEKDGYTATVSYDWHYPKAYTIAGATMVLSTVTVRRGSSPIYQRYVKGGEAELDDAMRLALAAIAKDRADREAPPVGAKPRMDLQFDEKAVAALEALAARTNNGMLKGMVALIRGGKDLTENQLKAIRAQFHRTGQHAQAEMFRPKTASDREAFLGLFENKTAPKGPSPRGSNWKHKTTLTTNTEIWLWQDPSNRDAGLFMIRRNSTDNLLYLSWFQSANSRVTIRYPKAFARPEPLFKEAAEIFPKVLESGIGAFLRWKKTDERPVMATRRIP
ncbi:MAG: hypothetical protein WC824_15540 [Bacteroidota bacterium]|jgi:hypothetical protein